MKKHVPSFDPFPRVSSRYGAPMGRTSDSPANLQDLPRLYAQHQGGGEGYDKGGAYWGLPSNVYAVWGREPGPDGEASVVYVRAASSFAAIRQVINGE